MTVIEALKQRGFETVEAAFYDKIQEWLSWYEASVKSFTWYKVWNGQTHVKCKRFSLEMAKKVSEDWANLLMNEKVKITLEGEKEQNFVNEVFAANNFIVKINEMQEWKSALGTVAYIPRVVGQVEGGQAREIQLDFVTAEHIYPLSWRNGIITECAFESTYTSGGKEYSYLQIHRKDENGAYIIENALYRRENGQLYEARLSDVPEFARVPASVKTRSDKRQFVIDRPNIANNYGVNIPMGVAVYANAIDVLKGVDIAYDSYVNEFVLGKKRIMVKPTAAKNLDGAPAFDNSDTVYYVLPEDIENGAVIESIDMTLRTAEHQTGIQDQMNLLSAKCGFGERHYKFDNGSVSTATQIVSENSTLFRTIKKHELVLEAALAELCRIILRLGNLAMQAGLNEDVEISIDFDDSIIEDKETDFNRDMRLLQAGIMGDVEFRMKWFNEDEETAKKALPKMEALTDERQDEIE